MNKKGQPLGVAGGIVKLIGGAIFIYLLITLFSTGALTGLVSSKAFIMVIIFLLVLWILMKKK